MKKIMFNDKYGLTQAVLEGRKTMTRRLVSNSLYEEWNEMDHDEYTTDWDKVGYLRERSPLKVGEVIAIAQSYKDIFSGEKNTHWFQEHPGWNNKMFVAAVNMPHHIKITKVGVEKLQDISEEDCLKEGVIERRIRPFNEIEIMYQVPLTTIYKENKKEAFAALIDKVSGKGTWEADPMVFVYSFELID